MTSELTDELFDCLRSFHDDADFRTPTHKRKSDTTNSNTNSIPSRFTRPIINL